MVGSLWLAMTYSYDTTAQLVVEPVRYTPPAKTVNRSGAAARTESHTPLSLPFWEDFSSKPPGYPDTTKWVKSANVIISDGAGIQPPSLNVAEFNALDSTGTPYNVIETSLSGYTDTLTSVAIRMDEVLPIERGSVYLSFEYQWRGNGEPPDPDDFLQVELKNIDGIWEIAQTIFGELPEDETAFNTALIQISEDRFFHDDFQFRIRSFGRLSGRYDTWMVDYIYLNKGRSNSLPLSFPDRALASSVSPLFGPYYGVPYLHFLASPELSPVQFDVNNLKNFEATTTFDAFATFRHYNEEDELITPSYTVQLDALSPVKGGTNSVLLPLERYTSTTVNMPDPNDPLQFDPDAKRVDIDLKVSLNSGDLTDDEPIALLDFTVNDTITTKYTLGDQYIYDDGIAEYSVKLTNPGNRVAYRFEMPIDTATLYGFDIYFTHLSGPASEPLDFQLYEDDGGVPTETPKLSILSRTITKNNNNEFFRVLINPPQFINDSVFYIGYKQSPSPHIRLGLDKNNDTGDQIYVFYNGTWTQNTDVHGSLMIRPVFGKGTGVINDVPEEQKEITSLYPNPNTGTFFIKGDVLSLNVLDMTGKPAKWVVEREDNISRISLSSPLGGLYVVRWSDRNGVYTRKVVVRN